MTTSSTLRPTIRPLVAPTVQKPSILPTKFPINSSKQPSFRPSSFVINTNSPLIPSAIPTSRYVAPSTQHHKLAAGPIVGIIIAVLASIGIVYFAARRYKIQQEEINKTRHSILKTYADEYSQEDFINPVLEASARAPKSVRTARGSRPSRTILAAVDTDGNTDIFGNSVVRDGHMPVDNDVILNPMHAQLDNSSFVNASDLLTVPLETPGGPQNLRPVSKQLFVATRNQVTSATDTSPMSPATNLAEQSVSSPMFSVFSSAARRSPSRNYEASSNAPLDHHQHVEGDPEYSDVSVMVDDEGANEPDHPVFESLVAPPPTDPTSIVSTATAIPEPAPSTILLDESDEFDRLTVQADTSAGRNRRDSANIVTTPNASSPSQVTSAIRTIRTDTERPCGRSPPTPESGSLQSPLSNSLQSLDISPIFKPSSTPLASTQSPLSSSPSRASVIHMSVLGASALMARETINTPVSSKSINEIDIDSPSPLTNSKLPPASETTKKKRASNPPSPIKRTVGRDSRSPTPVRSRGTDSTATPLSSRSDAPTTSRLDTARKGGFLEDTEASRQRRRDRSAGDLTARSETDETTPLSKGSPKKSIVEDIERARWPEALQGDGHRFHKPLAEPRAIYPLHTSKTAGVSSQSSPGGIVSEDGDGNLASPLDGPLQSKQDSYDSTRGKR